MVLPVELVVLRVSVIVNVAKQARQKIQEFGVPPVVQYHSGNLYNHPIVMIYSTFKSFLY